MHCKVRYAFFSFQIFFRISAFGQKTSAQIVILIYANVCLSLGTKPIPKCGPRRKCEPNADTHFSFKYIYFNNFVKTSNKIVKHGFRFLSRFISSNLSQLFFFLRMTVFIQFASIETISYTFGRWVISKPKSHIFFFLLIHRGTETTTHSWRNERRNEKIDRNIIFSYISIHV